MERSEFSGTTGYSWHKCFHFITFVSKSCDYHVTDHSCQCCTGLCIESMHNDVPYKTTRANDALGKACFLTSDFAQSINLVPARTIHGFSVISITHIIMSMLFLPKPVFPSAIEESPGRPGMTAS